MPTYSIKAPDGNTYDIDGPDGATDEQVRARVLAAHPNAAKPSAGRQASAKMDAALRAEGGASGNFLTDAAAGAGKAITDMGLGARQLAAQFGLGDKDALNAEAAAKEKTDAALMDTSGGMVGKYGTDFASAFLPMGLAAKAVKGAGMIPGMARAAGVGATQGVLTPDEDYSALEQGGTGAAFGVGGDVAGRAAGRLLKPMQGAMPAYLSEHLGNIGTLPKKLATDLTDSRLVKALTNALSMTPAGGGVTAARRANSEAVTEAITSAAGLPVKQATPSKMRAIEDNLKQGYERFDRLPDVTLTDIPAELRPVLDTLLKEARIAGATKAPSTLRSTIEGSFETIPGKPAGGVMLPDGTMSIPAVPPSTKPVTISAKELLDLRSRASTNAFKTDDSLTRTANLAIKDALEDQMFNTLPEAERVAFRKLNDQWSTWERIKKAGVQGEHDTIRAGDYANQLSKNRQVAPRTPLDKLVVSAERTMPTPPLSENRSLMTRVLTGGGLATGAGMLAGLPGLAAAAGSLGLAHTLLGTPAGGRYLTGQAQSKVGKALQSDKTLEMLRQLGLAGATTVGE